MQWKKHLPERIMCRQVHENIYMAAWYVLLFSRLIALPKCS